MSQDPDSGEAFSADSHPLIGDAGPIFDPDEAADTAPTPLEAEPELEPGWQPRAVRRVVRFQGQLTHEAVGVGVEDWVWRDDELEALCPALAEMLNSYPVTRAAAAFSNELTIGAVTFEYAIRSIRERTKVLRARQQAEAAAQHRPQPPASAPPLPSDAGGGSHAFDIPTPEEWKVPGA